MNLQTTKTEKLLLIAIAIVITVICTVLYWGTLFVLSNTSTATIDSDTNVPLDNEEAEPQEEVIEILTEEQKLNILKQLKTTPSDMSKEDRLNIMEEIKDESSDESELSTQQKLDILKQL